MMVEEINILRRAQRKYKSLKRRNLEARKSAFASTIAKEEKIIILGNQKTGSTAIADLVAKRARKSVMLDVQGALYNPEWLLKQRYQLSELIDFIFEYRSEFDKFIIKEPSLTFFYSDLIKCFPNAKVSFIIRDPLQNIRSILNRLQIPGDLNDISIEDWPELNYMPTWKLAIDSTWLGFPSRNYIEALAYRWCCAADVYLTNSDNIYLIKYEEFVDKKISVIDDFCSYHGLERDVDIGQYLNRQYQNKGKSNVDLLKFFGSKNYQIIMDICYSKAREFGYK